MEKNKKKEEEGGKKDDHHAIKNECVLVHVCSPPSSKEEGKRALRNCESKDTCMDSNHAAVDREGEGEGRNA